MNTLRHQTFLLVLSTLIVGPIDGKHDAQGQGFLRPTANRAGRLIEPPRTMLQQLRAAEQAIEEGRLSDAVVQLGDLLAGETETEFDDDLAGQDFFLGINDLKEGIPADKSLLRTAREILGNLPDQARNTYQLRYGPIAAKNLLESSSSRDWSGIEEVRRRYFHTTAGFEASAALAQRAIYQGHPLEASLILDDIVLFPAAIAHLGPKVLLQHAWCRFSCQRELPEQSGIYGRILSVGPDQLQFQNREELKVWLEERSSKDESLTSSSAPMDDHALFGARSDRNGTAAGEMPLTNLRWKLPTTASPRQEKAVRGLAESLATSGNLPPPSWSPIRVGSQLLMRTTERLVGVDFRTGKRVWTYPWQSSLQLVNDQVGAISFDQLTGFEGVDERLQGRVWNDVPYGQVTSDGERVFMLDDLSDIEMASFARNGWMRGTRPADTRKNTLVALELKTEGKLLWHLGQNGQAGTPFSEAFFLGPPLPLDGRLYAMAEIAGDIVLCCLDPQSGSELWCQQLVAVETGSVDSDPIRRVSGAMPTYHEGVLICPTGAGATVAVNLADRTLRWGSIYRRQLENLRNSARSNRLDTSSLMQRWDNGLAVASGMSVLVTPPESNRLFGMDLLTGKYLFSSQNRGVMRYLAGVRNGKFILAGQGSVRAFNLDNGTTAWTSPTDMLTAGQQICGRGFFGNDRYIVPTTTNQLISVSLDDGTVLQRRNTRYSLGNLVAVGGEVIVQGPTSLAVAFGEKSLKPLVDKMLKEDPENFEAIVRKAELLIQDGDRQTALGLLTKARQMQPDNDEVHMLSVSAMLGMLREKPESSSQYIDQLVDLIDLPSQRVELLALRLRGAIKRTDWPQAVDHAINMSKLLGQESQLDGVADDILADSSRSCTLDCWLSARTKQILDECSEGERDSLVSTVESAAIDSIQSSTSNLTRFVRHFQGWPAIQTAVVELIDRHRKRSDYYAIERTLLGIGTTPTSVDDAIEQYSETELHLLAENYAAASMTDDALRMLTLLESLPNSAIPEDRLAELSEAINFGQTNPNWPDSVGMDWQTTDSFRTMPTRGVQSLSAKTKITSGTSFVGWRLGSESSSALSLRDRLGNIKVIPGAGVRTTSSNSKEAVVSGGAMIVLLPDSLLCIDLDHVLRADGEAIRWRHALGNKGEKFASRISEGNDLGDQELHYYLSAATAAQGAQEFRMGPILGDRMIMLVGGDLVAIDLITDETLWRNSTAPKSGKVVCNGDRVAVVSDENKEVVFFNVRDGQFIEKRVWTNGSSWESSDRYILTIQSNPTDRTVRLRLVDPFEDEVLLEHDSMTVNRSNQDQPCGYGRVIDGRYLVNLQSDGSCIVWDIVQGIEVSRQMLDAHDDLRGLHAIALDGQILLLPKRLPEKRTMRSPNETLTTNGINHQSTSAAISISMLNGEVQWNQEFDDPWGVTLNQAYSTPLVLFSRSPFNVNQATNTRKRVLDLMAVNARSGKLVIQEQGKEIAARTPELLTKLTVQPLMNTLIARLGVEHKLTFKFGVAAKSATVDKANQEKVEAAQRKAKEAAMQEALDAGKEEAIDP